MNMWGGGDMDFVIDMKSSSINAANENDNNACQGNNLLHKMLNRGEDALSFEDRLHICSEDGVVLFVNKFAGGDEKAEDAAVDSEKPKKKKKGFKKHPKPPRPPRPLSLDIADQMLIKEISELAMLKKSRAERMKALKKSRNRKAASLSSSSSSSIGNTFALIITLVFCIVIIWQGIFSKGGNSSMRATGGGGRGGFISIQFNGNASTKAGSS